MSKNQTSRSTSITNTDASRRAIVATAGISWSKSNALSQFIAQLSSQFDSRWQALTPRDRMALTVLFLFLSVLIIGYGGYSIHTHASKSKADYQEAVSDYFWLRSQAGNINTESASTQRPADMPPATMVTQTLNQAGINDASVAAAGQSVQMSFTHDSQAIVGRVLGALQQQGWKFSRLDIQQDDTTKQLRVQATLNL